MEIFDLREKLSALEHKRWLDWSVNLTKTEKVTRPTIERWKTMWISYYNLDEEHKEKNRFWADRILKLLVDEGVLPKHTLDSLDKV